MKLLDPSFTGTFAKATDATATRGTKVVRTRTSGIRLAGLFEAYAKTLSSADPMRVQADVRARKSRR